MTATTWQLWSVLIVAALQQHQAEVVHERGLTSLYKPWRKSRFVPNARYAGAWRRKPTPRDLVCAHRWLPFGTVLRITNRLNGKQALCVVLDRGPFGTCVPAKSKAVKVPQCKRGYRYRVITNRRKVPSGGFYRGVIDATPRVHRMMESTGWTWAKVERLVGIQGRPRDIERFLRENVPSI